MEILLDTHIILWNLAEPEKLPKKALEILLDGDNVFYYSIASMWEVAIKHALRKIEISGSEFLHYCEMAGFKKLPIDDRHVCALETLEKKPGTPSHNDPFDRMLISQAKADCMMFLTHDKSFSFYAEPYVAIM